MRGKILQASGGSLFLDEIGDMPLDLQSRLLRVLAENEVQPIGAETPIAVDLHVICATHRDLSVMCDAGTFRADLLYRLNGATFELPPLRDRQDRDDLISKILAEENAIADKSSAIAPAARERLHAYRWPGNIRELRNVLRYAVSMCDSACIEVGDLPPELARNAIESGAALRPQSNNAEDEAVRIMAALPPPPLASRCRGARSEAVTGDLVSAYATAGNCRAQSPRQNISETLRQPSQESLDVLSHLRPALMLSAPRTHTENQSNPQLIPARVAPGMTLC